MCISFKWKKNYTIIAIIVVSCYIAWHLSHKKWLQIEWTPKIQQFLEVNSRVMPYKKDTILINGERVTKCHMLSSKFEAYMIFKTANPESTRNFTTFLKMIINLSYRLVCVGIKVYNLEQKLNALNKLAISLITETSSTVDKC